MRFIHKMCMSGCSDAAISLYRQVFGCEVKSVIHYRDAVANGWEPPCPEKDDTVYHSELLLGDTELRIVDDSDEMADITRRVEHPVGMDTAEEVERAFALLAEGGEIVQPLERPPYMVIIGQVRDRFGILWTLMCDF